MKLTRKKRIALELLGPPALGAGIPTILFGGASLIESLIKGSSIGHLKDVGSVAALYFFYAYFIVGLQSILYTVIMERRFKHGLDPCSWRMVRMSSLLGFGSGAILAVFAINDPKIMGGIVLIMGGLGLVVGFLIGLLIKWWSAEKPPAGEITP